MAGQRLELEPVPAHIATYKEEREQSMSCVGKARYAVVSAALALVMTAGMSALAPVAYAGVGEDIECAEAVAVPQCMPAVEFGPGENVTSFRFNLLANSTVYVTITLANSQGQGRTERTVSFINATQQVRHMTWHVPDYHLDMDMRIIRVEFHAH